jgi:hypothetical protein
MDLIELVRALCAYDALAARQWVADAIGQNLRLSGLPMPQGLSPVEIAVAAGVVEMLAERWQQEPPPWTRDVPGADPTFLVRAAATLPRLRRTCELEGPEPLRRRRLYAPPDFLVVV